MRLTNIAFDAQPSVRSVDNNGFMRIASSNLTRSGCFPYRGSEIPHHADYGFHPDKIYIALRPDDEIQRAAPTFDGLPLLMNHHYESAQAPQKEFRVGSLGDHAHWDKPYLKNSLFVTDSAAIKLIEDGDAKELSCAYTYDVDPTAGTWTDEDGRQQHYDFIMRNLAGNHVALVPKGRSGSECVVADEDVDSDTVAFVTDENETNKDVTNDAEKTKSVLEGLTLMFDKNKAYGNPDAEDKEVDLAQEIIDLHRTDPSTGKAMEPISKDAEEKEERVRELVDKLTKDMDPEDKRQLGEAFAEMRKQKEADEEGMGEDDEPVSPNEALADAERKSPIEEEDDEDEGEEDDKQIGVQKDAELDGIPDLLKNHQDDEGEEDKCKDSALVPTRKEVRETRNGINAQARDDDVVDEADEEEEIVDDSMMDEMRAAAEKCKCNADDPLFKSAFMAGIKAAQKKEPAPAPQMAPGHDCAMDAAIQAAENDAKKRVINHFREVSKAIEDTRSVIGNVDIMAFDSAEEVYGEALKRQGVDIARYDKSAWKPMFDVMGDKPRALAQDSHPGNVYTGPFSGLGRIRSY